MHGQYVQQADHGEEAVHLATLAADDREPAVLELESPERLDEHVHSGRVHERDLGQIQDYRTDFALEDWQQDLAQQRRRLEIDLPVGTEHHYVVMMLVGGERADRQPTEDAPRGASAGLRG